MKKKNAKKPASKTSSAKGNIKNESGVQPLGDRVLVRRFTAEEQGQKLPSGIIIPDTAKEKSEKGVIVAVGDGRLTDEGKRVPMALRPGQKVMFSYGDDLKMGGVEYVLVREDNVLAILN